MKVLVLLTALFVLCIPNLAVAEDDDDFEEYFKRLNEKLDVLIGEKCPTVECPPEVVCPPCGECLIQFVDDVEDLEGAALTVYRVYAEPTGKLFLIPTWAIDPTPKPPVDPPVDPPIPGPLVGEVKDNACLQCHEDDEGRRFLLSNSRDWKQGDSGHEKHEKQSCSKCHIE